MNLDLKKIAEYERVIPLCAQALAETMPGVDIILRDDLVLISSVDYPSPDTNRAFLLRATPQTVEDLIDEVTSYFKAREMPTTILISPACTPPDLAQRLLQRGFVKQEPDESWLVFEHLQAAKIPKTDPRIAVRQVSLSEIGTFVEVMAAAYEMPPEWIPGLVKAMEPSVGHPNMSHYLAFINDKPLATLTLMRHQNYAVVGSGGVVPEHRGSTLIFNLAVTVISQAQKEGVDTVLGQTTLGPIFERFLRIYGFKQAFKRAGYMLA